MQEAHGDPTRINGKHQGNPSHLRVHGDHTLRTELPKVPWNPRAHTHKPGEKMSHSLFRMDLETIPALLSLGGMN